MKRHLPALAAGLVIAAAACGNGQSQDANQASATVRDANGNAIAQVRLSETPNGVHLRAEFTGAPAGAHGFHIHETGQCSGDFSSAGGHFNPKGRSHGFTVAAGPHLGDMPNVHIPESGALTVEFFAPEVGMVADGVNTLFDSDGAAIVLHQGTDDYESQPSGAAGPRLGCGVIERR